MKMLAAAAFALLATPALACPPGSAQLFVCGGGDFANEGYIEMCDLTGEGDETDLLQFEMHAADGKQMRFPPNPADGPKSFFFSNSDGEDGYLVDMRFSTGEKDFRLYSLYTPPETDDETDVGGGAAGVVIKEADGSITNFSCGERPYMFISYLRDSMSCDLANPVGEPACHTRNVPYRQAPLGEEDGAPAFLPD